MLKNGCRIEALQLLDDPARGMRMSALSHGPGHLMRMGRNRPDLAARLLFDPEEVQAVYLLSQQRYPRARPDSTT